MVWFYLVGYVLSHRKSELCLSIPLWSDFIVPNISEIRSKLHENFQSHYGLILSIYRLMVMGLIKTTFNPTMVWFYLQRVGVEWLERTNFQSHYGLILSWSTCCNTDGCCFPFNPTMVWFYQHVRWSPFIAKWSLSIPLWSDFIIYAGVGKWKEH